MASPAIVNSSVNGSTAPSSEHNRKASLTISSSGTSGNIPNGGPVTTTARPPIFFGSQSPAIANSVPLQQQSASLQTPPPAAHVNSPAKSPSPIPNPAASGGRPPSLPQGQTNGMSFGSMPVSGSAEGDLNRGSMRGAHPQGPAGNQVAPQHLRRESSQSMHGDMGSPGMQHQQQHGGPNRGGYMAPSPGGRGRGFQNYAQPVSGSPSAPFRQLPNQRHSTHIPPHIQNQMNQYPHSPQQQPRSPGPGISHPATPQMQQSMPPMAGPPNMGYPPSFPAFHSQLGPHSNQFAHTSFDPNYPYYQAPYQMTPQYLQQNIPGSPRQFNRSIPPNMQQPYGPGPYNQPPSQNMSRTSSQLSERPASSLGSSHPHQPHSSNPSIQSGHNHSQSVGGPASNGSSSIFTLPSKEKKGLVIKNPADGAVMNIDKPVAATPSPSNASAAPTPPPINPTVSHVRADSKTGKTAEEIKAEFIASVKRKEEASKIKEEEEADPKPEASAASAPSTNEQVATGMETVAVAASATEKSTDSKAAPAAPVAQAIAEPPQGANNSQLDEEERLRQEEEERMIAEMEAAEREEEEREKAFKAKKDKEKAEKAEREKQAAANADEEMRRLEREAEAAEEARQNKKQAGTESDDGRAERENLFASLKKATIGPGADTPSGTETPTSGQSTPPQGATSAQTAVPSAAQKPTGGVKPRPAALKIDPTKAIEPPQPTAGMQSLKSARMLQIRSEAVNYPEGIKSPNPALIQGGKRNGKVYDKDFLMQFQDVFKEKPSVDWDQRLKETLGDGSEPATPKTGGRNATPTSGTQRNPSNRGMPQPQPPSKMGSFHGSMGPMPGGHFPAAPPPRPGMGGPLGSFARGAAPFPMGTMPAAMIRPPSLQGKSSHSGRPSGSQRGKDGRAPSKAKEAELNAKMPLTAKEGVKELEQSKNGWKPQSLSRTPAANAPDASGNMPPDMVQRKVKSNLNKMTPERFEKIADQILAIAAQSKDELDGRTLRQVIQLTFEKACDEAHWASMYAKFCLRMLETMSNDIKDENVRDKNGQVVTGGPLFRKYLLNRCQEEFERGWEVNLPEREEGQTEEATMLSDEYYKAAAAKRRGLGLIQFIGELYKLRMLSIKIMHQCFMKLLDFDGMPDESGIESLVKLLRTVGATMETAENGPAMVSTYMERVEKIMSMSGLPSRMHYMLLDVIDLRRSGWHSKDDAKGPKTIQEIHNEAAIAQQQAELEKQRQNQRGGRMPAGRGDARNFSGGPMPPPDYQRNQADTADLRKLGQRSASRQTGAGGLGPSKQLGPTSMFSSMSRSGSGRQSLGPSSMMMAREGSSRSGSQRGAKKEGDETPSAATNSFSALAALDGSTDERTPVSSPSLARASPATPGGSGLASSATADSTSEGQSSAPAKE